MLPRGFTPLTIEGGGMLGSVRSHLKARAAMIALAPALFWMLATSIEIARRDPAAFETPLIYLAVTWLLYLPVFGLAGVLLIGGTRFVRIRFTHSWWLGAVAGGGLAVLCLSIASATYHLPMRVWPLCFVVGAAMGAGLMRCHVTRVS
jgi:uncharacterized membrane protein